MDNTPVDLEYIVERENARLTADPEEPLFLRIDSVLENIRPADWLIKGIVERDAFMVLYGPSGNGKSFIAMDIAASVATGAPWHSKPVKPGSVFYIAGEGHNGIARRFSAWEIHNGTKLSGSPLAVSTRPICLDDQSAARDVSDEIEILAQRFDTEPALIVVDTLARNFAGDENLSKDMSLFIKTLDNIRQRWGATIIVVHHSGKNADRGARGSSALKAAADAEYSVTMDENKVVTLQAHKMKDCEIPEPIAFTLKGVELSITDDEGSPVWSCCPALLDGGYIPPSEVKRRPSGKNQILAMELLNILQREHEKRIEDSGRDADEAKVSIEDWRNSFCGTANIQNSRQRFHDAKKALLEHGFIKQIGLYVRVSERTK